MTDAESRAEVQARYQTEAIMTASPDDLGLMLYRAALHACSLCQAAIRAEEWAGVVRHGGLVQDIMAGMADSMVPGVPEAMTMRNLYLYCWQQAVIAQQRHEVESLDPVKTVLENLIRGLEGHKVTTAAPLEYAMAGETSGGIDFSG